MRRYAETYSDAYISITPFIRCYSTTNKPMLLNTPNNFVINILNNDRYILQLKVLSKYTFFALYNLKMVDETYTPVTRR